MTNYIVKAPMIVVRVPGAQGGETYMTAGRPIPTSVEEAEIDRLLELGLIEEAIDETALVAQLDAAAGLIASRELAELARIEAQRIYDEELAPQFELRVQEAAEQRFAAQHAEQHSQGDAAPGAPEVQIPAGDPKNSWTETQIDAYGARMDPPLIFGNGTKAEKLAAIADARKG